MQRNLLIELLEDGEKVSLYSPHFEGEEYSEFGREVRAPVMKPLAWKGLPGGGETLGSSLEWRSGAQTPA